MTMAQPEPNGDPIEAFAVLMDGMCQAVAARGAALGLALPLIALILTRLRRLANRFTRILATAGRPGDRRPARPRPETPIPQPAAARPQPEFTLPREVGWLTHLLTETFARFDLQFVLAGNRMEDLVAAHPDLGSVLRPLCRMLAIPLPINLRRPRSPRPPRIRPRKPPVPRTPRWKDPIYPRGPTADGILPRPAPFGPASRFWSPKFKPLTP